MLRKGKIVLRSDLTSKPPSTQTSLKRKTEVVTLPCHQALEGNGSDGVIDPSGSPENLYICDNAGCDKDHSHDAGGL